MAIDLQAQFLIHVEVLVADLSQSSSGERVESQIYELTNLRMLLNNAWFGDPGTFAHNSLEHILAVIDVHIVAGTRLSHRRCQE